MHFWSFVFSFLFCVVLTAGIRYLAIFFNAIPKSDYRRQQKGAIALWGGLAIYLTLIAAYVIEPQEQLKDLIIASSLLLVTGLLDDRFELKATAKFGMQFAAAFAWLYINRSDNFLLDAGLPPFIGLTISTLWIVGLCNAYNLIDGTDGQCSLAALVSFVIIGISFPTLIPTAIPLIGATVGFLFWNLPPARIYLGESGSTLLGFSLATMTLSLPVNFTPGPIILGSLFLVAFPLTDTVLAIARRIQKKRPIFSGDKDHIHHLLQKLGFSKTQTLFIVGFMMVTGGMTAFNLFQMNMTSSLILTLNNAALMSFALYGLYHTKRIAAQKVSYFGKSLLEKHMYRMNQDPVNLSCKKGYLIDLLPYYADLQSSGIGNIINFVKEISLHFGNVSNNYHLYSVGSYSVAALYDDGQNWTEVECEIINQHLKDIFLQFGVLKSLNKTPEGVFYYDIRNIETLLNMIDANSENKQSIQVLKAG